MATTTKRTYTRKPHLEPKGKGAKFDSGKARLDLITPEFENSMGMILTHGVLVHGEDSWKTIPEPQKRYLAALKRHTNAIARGEVIDAGTGQTHAGCIGVNAMFLQYFQSQK